MNKNLRAAFYFTLDFQKRVLTPIAQYFKNSLITNEPESLKTFRPDFVFTADYSCKFLSEYFKDENVFIMAVRHGAVNKYSEPEDDFCYADFVFGTEYEKKYLESGNIKPRMKFVVTGNPWVDETFRIPNRPINQNTPTILFAPTYNPEISAAAIPGNKLYELISKVFSDFNLIIKPHPAILDRRPEHLKKYEETFDQWLFYWKSLKDNFNNVRLIDDPSESIANFFAHADILISDRSSLIWEFIILERPVLLYNSEDEPELWNKYSTEYSIKNKIDVGPYYKDEDQFLSYLKDIFKLHHEFYSERQRVYKNELFGKYQDDFSAKRVADEISGIFENEISNRIIEEAEFCIQNNNFDRAREILNKACDYDKFKEDALNDLAYIEIISGDYDRAVEYLQTTLALNPNNDVAFSNLNYLIENQLADPTEIKTSLLKIFKTPLTLNKLSSFDDFVNYERMMRSEYKRRNEFERKLIPENQNEFTYNAYCIVCNHIVPLHVDFWNAYQNNGNKIPNWRERLVCPICGLNNRMRLTYHLIQELFPDFNKLTVYTTEQTTVLFQLLKKLNSKIFGSEFLGCEIARGEILNGIRNEDFTQLSF
ncbi:CDP-glycerol glycerophosphotransferase family protein, partial [Ignavibacterium album]|uniref:CDP-glycerol glycerophosphotransferase family protein n=1 Tax=Ignavibacterium album TaxID=591197 RepID=UPI0026EB730A